ncbi:MAG TPA: hotdog fold thioesterase [Chitinophagaceae bacterium]|nr:hotdog fold thioesterase [Chitinophagaceae bacterium]
MPIWFDARITLDKIQPLSRHTLAEHLGIVWTEIGPDHLCARMPVDHRTRQPYGLLHGGASCVLAESLGSVASALVLDPSRFRAVGLEINANHLRAVSQGYVTGRVTPIHLGNSTHVWDIRIQDEQGRLTCVSRLTVAVLQKKD